MDKRIRKFCRKQGCQGSWLIEPAYPNYKESFVQSQIRNNRRVPGYCHCGTPLYEELK